MTDPAIPKNKKRPYLACEIERKNGWFGIDWLWRFKNQVKNSVQKL